jgi:hypothetical protein
MKKLCMVLSLAGVMAAPNLFASMSVTLYQDTGNYSAGVGGEFRAVGDVGLNSVVNWSAYASSTAVKDSYFQTFCTETVEEFTPGNSYPVTSIGNNALYNGTDHPVPITLGVAYLYSQFAAGTLSGYDYTYGSGRVASAGNLQDAIWTLLGEGSYGITGTAYNALMAWDSNPLDWTKAANGAFGVADMVLDNPGQAQDQLVIVVPEPTTVVAGALLLLPFGASTLRILRKNRVA